MGQIEFDQQYDEPCLKEHIVPLFLVFPSLSPFNHNLPRQHGLSEDEEETRRSGRASSCN